MRSVSRTVAARFAVLAVAALLAGCASGATPSAMVPVQSAAFEASSPLRNAIAVADVSGGSETNPLWMSRVSNGDFDTALKLALKNEGLLAEDPAKAAMQLRVMLLSLDQPWIGFTLSVTSTVRYAITRSAGANIAFDDTVVATDQASVGDAFIAVERLRIANERSIRSNITEFLARLKKSGPPGAGAPAPTS